MDTIIAGNFEHRQQADGAVYRLEQEGAPRADICVFAVNAEGQHQGIRTGGDVDADPQAQGGESGGVRGAVIGTAVGAGLGLVAAPLAPIVAPALVLGAAAAGAYAGGLAGAVKNMGEDKPETEDAPPPRSSGVLVAIRAVSPEQQSLAARVLRDCGAREIEHAQGTWTNGEWSDFDPVQRPQLIGSP